MNQTEFEKQVLHLWMTTRVPLTRANLLYFTHVPRKKLDGWLDQMVGESVLDVDSDDDGEMIWLVRGAERAASGPARVEEVIRLERLRGEAAGRRSAGQISAIDVLPGAARDALARSGGRKSTVLSGALSLLGPVGWFYAGPVKEALPATILYYFAMSFLHFLPGFIGGPLGSLLTMLSVVIGVIYASQYNRAGQVTPLFGGEDTPKLPGRRWPPGER